MSLELSHILSPNGLPAPSGFPVAPYESIYKTVSARIANQPSYEHFAGAWNAIVYRYCEAVDQKDAFVDSIVKHGSAPPPKERYRQERILFDLFSSGFSTLESTFYGLYAIGIPIDPSHFSLSSEKDQQRVSPTSTKNAYLKAFPGDPISTALESIFGDGKYIQLREIRNILTHRTAPGRLMYLSLGTDDTPATEWKLKNIPIDKFIATDAVSELSRLLSQLLEVTADFVDRRYL